VSVSIDKYGIGVDDFDKTINEMNEIQDELMYGGYIE
jgi:hypothetical protein